MPQAELRIVALRGDLTLHYDLCLKTLKVAKDRGDRSYASSALKAEEAIFAHDVAIDHDLVPRLRMTDIVDRDIVVLNSKLGILEVVCVAESGDVVRVHPIVRQLANDLCVAAMM